MVELGPELTHRVQRAVHVHVRETGADGLDELGDLAGRDALGAGAEDVPRRDGSRHGGRSGGAGLRPRRPVAQVGAQEGGDPAGLRSRTEVNVRLGDASFQARVANRVGDPLLGFVDPRPEPAGAVRGHRERSFFVTGEPLEHRDVRTMRLIAGGRHVSGGDDRPRGTHRHREDEKPLTLGQHPGSPLTREFPTALNLDNPPGAARQQKNSKRSRRAVGPLTDVRGTPVPGQVRTTPILGYGPRRARRTPARDRWPLGGTDQARRPSVVARSRPVSARDAPYIVERVMVALAKSAPSSTALMNRTLSMTACRRRARVRTARDKTAPLMSARSKTAPVKSAPTASM